MAEIDTSIYRQPPQPNILDSISKVGGAADTLGNLAVGGAVQGAMDPATGEIDQNKLANILRQSPAGAMKAIPTLDALQKLRAAGFGADQAGLETFQKRMAITHHLFSGLASKDKPTMDDVHDIAATALDPRLDAKKYGITMPVIMNAISQFRGPDGKPLSPAQIKQKALQIQSQAATTSEVLEQHSPRHEVIDRGGNLEIVPTGTRSNPAMGTTVPKNLPPTTPVATEEGTRYLGEQPAPAPSAVRPGIGAQIPVRPAIPPIAGSRKDQSQAGPVASPDAPLRPIPVPTTREPPVTPQPRGPAASLAPGYGEAMAGIAASSARGASSLIEANDTSMMRKSMLGNLEDDLKKFTSGPGADWTLLAKSFTNRNIPVPKSWQEAGGILDPKSIAGQEQFNKQAVQLAQAQFAAIGGTGTDAKFDSAFKTSPNETLSQLGNQGIMRLLKGNEDAIQAKTKAWQAWRKEPGHGPQTYPEFSTEFNSHFDPRAFQFKYQSPQERQDYLDSMDRIDRQRFLDDLTYARKQGWIDFGVKK